MRPYGNHTEAGEFYNVDIPKNADHFTLIMTFTDVFLKTPSYFSQIAGGGGNGLGDMPDIIGYWTGYRDAQGWHIQANIENTTIVQKKPGDNQISPSDPKYPNAAKILGIETSVKKKLEQIGYYLFSRPAFGQYWWPVAEYMLNWANKGDLNRQSQKDIRDAIDLAVKQKEICSIWDTGYDIRPNPGDPGYPK